MTIDPQLTVRNLSVRFERWGEQVVALKDVDLAVAASEWVAVTGHNGSGKSTLLRAIAGQQPLWSGTVTVGGADITRSSLANRAAAVLLIHQNPLLGTAPLLTTIENLRVAVPGAHERSWFTERLDEVGLAARANQPARLLSGGERQLLTLLIARLRMPPLLLLDEPFSALDPMKEALALRLLAEVREAGSAILHVTHQPERLRDNATRLVRLEAGAVVEDTYRKTAACAVPREARVA